MLMNTIADNLLSSVNRLTGLLGPVSLLIDGVVERLVPKSAAQAACYPAGSTVCYYTCFGVTCSPVTNPGHRPFQLWAAYAPAGGSCGSPHLCYYSCGCH